MTVMDSAVGTTMPLEDVLKLVSGDFGVPVAEVWDLMEGRDCHSYPKDYPTCQDYVLHLAEDMEGNGWNGPPVCVEVEPQSDWVDLHGEWLPTLTNGHHRTMAAWLAGVTDIPTTDRWVESEDSW